jgi:dynein heavy chain, axonemal
MLCLSNGERIKLSSQSRVLFEVQDLNQASPATVSRCGMVWVSEDVVTWEDYVDGFFQRNTIAERKDQQDFLLHLVKNSFRKGYAYIKKFCK